MRSRRGDHPDLDPESGDVKWTSYLYSDPREKAFMEMWNDPQAQAAFMARLEARQREEHPDVQAWVGGQTFAPDQSPYHGHQRYQEVLRYARGQVARNEGMEAIIHGEDVAEMSMQEYDKFFDERGQPREGVIYRPTSRDTRVDDSMSGSTASEMQQARARARPTGGT